jgi:hypothetical protein
LGDYHFRLFREIYDRYGRNDRITICKYVVKSLAIKEMNKNLEPRQITTLNASMDELNAYYHCQKG